MSKTLTPEALKAVRTIAEANRDADLKIPASFLLEILDFVEPLDPAPGHEVFAHGYSACAKCGELFWDFGRAHFRCVDCAQKDS